MKNAFVAEFSALVSAHAECVLRNGPGPSDESLGQFHRQSTNRFNLWLRQIDTLGRDSDQTIDSPSMRARGVLEMAERILVYEILTRVWAAVLAASDAARGVRKSEPIARNVLYGHMMCRHEFVSRILQLSWLDHHTLRAIDRIRKKAERWTDLLVGHLVCRFGVEDVAYDDLRALEFARQHLDQNITNPDSHVWSLILIGIRLAFPSNSRHGGFATADDCRIIETVLTTQTGRARANPGT